MTPTYAAIPVEATKQPNPVKATPESMARAKKWWTLDCAMCHGKDGDGKGETAKDMKLAIADFTDPATLKDRTDGEIFYIIKNGHKDMPPEGQRVKTEQNWGLVNYVRSLAKKKSDAEQKPQFRDGGISRSDKDFWCRTALSTCNRCLLVPPGFSS
jgi:mono/diheme cytochrome c family protein